MTYKPDYERAITRLASDKVNLQSTIDYITLLINTPDISDNLKIEAIRRSLCSP